MTLSTTLTNLGDAVRSGYLITDKLKIAEITDLVSGKSQLERGLGDQPYSEGVTITKGEDSYTLTANKASSRIAIDIIGKPVLTGKTMIVYFQASTDDADGVAIKLGPISGQQEIVTITGATMQGHYIPITFTANNSLSIVFDKVTSIHMKDLRAWIIN